LFSLLAFAPGKGVNHPERAFIQMKSSRVHAGELFGENNKHLVFICMSICTMRGKVKVGLPVEKKLIYFAAWVLRLRTGNQT